MSCCIASLRLDSDRKHTYSPLLPESRIRRERPVIDQAASLTSGWQSSRTDYLECRIEDQFLVPSIPKDQSPVFSFTADGNDAVRLPVTPPVEVCIANRATRERAVDNANDQGSFCVVSPPPHRPQAHAGSHQSKSALQLRGYRQFRDAPGHKGHWENENRPALPNRRIWPHRRQASSQGNCGYRPGRRLSCSARSSVQWQGRRQLSTSRVLSWCVDSGCLLEGVSRGELFGQKMKMQESCVWIPSAPFL
jgi:hypothetical protein